MQRITGNDDIAALEATKLAQRQNHKRELEVLRATVRKLKLAKEKQKMRRQHQRQSI